MSENQNSNSGNLLNTRLEQVSVVLGLAGPICAGKVVQKLGHVDEREGGQLQIAFIGMANEQDAQSATLASKSGDTGTEKFLQGRIAERTQQATAIEQQLPKDVATSYYAGAICVGGALGIVAGIYCRRGIAKLDALSTNRRRRKSEEKLSLQDER